MYSDLLMDAKIKSYKKKSFMRRRRCRTEEKASEEEDDVGEEVVNKVNDRSKVNNIKELGFVVL
ncbi:hypothetical protein AXX17_AT4G01710 [Arabidopsis thaliana]|uniref:Uncharacterized protein n=2 Tax=Arabidopsis thaliana TaxID=3702 RepID=A0A178UVK4_ARATH|nr:hypothetical protein AXX17_AT4G01710 [Arabidopsis thaliana]